MMPDKPVTWGDILHLIGDQSFTAEDLKKPVYIYHSREMFVVTDINVMDRKAGDNNDDGNDDIRTFAPWVEDGTYFMRIDYAWEPVEEHDDPEIKEILKAAKGII
jgi:hypothetical protein